MTVKWTHGTLVGFLLVGAAASAHGQGWTRYYDGASSGDENANAVARDAAGNLYVAGSTAGAGGTTDLLLLKYSASGDLLWERVHDASAGDDEAVALALDGAGNPILAGLMRPAHDTDVIVLKYDAAGTLAWLRTFSGSALSNDEPVAIATDTSNRVVVCGSTFGPATGPDILLLQYAEDGSPNWSLQLDGGANWGEDPTALGVMASGEIVVSALTTRPDFTTDVLTVRCSSAGAVQWMRLYGGPGDQHDWPHALALDSSGNAYVTGFVGNGGGNPDCMTLRYGADGTLAWARLFDGPHHGFDSGTALTIDESANVFVAGAARDIGGRYDFLTLKYSGTGDLLWWRITSDSEDLWDEAGFVVPDGNGGVMVTGISEGPADDFDVLTLRYSADGALQARLRLDGSSAGYDAPCGVVPAGPSLMVLAGIVARAGTGDDIVTTLFDPSADLTATEEQDAPTEIRMAPVRPNPLGPRDQGVVRFEIPRHSVVSLELLDVAGRVVRRWMQEESVAPGYYTERLAFGGNSGIFFLRLRVREGGAGTTRLQKVVYLR